jgi:hypothetical protein
VKYLSIHVCRELSLPDEYILLRLHKENMKTSTIYDTYQIELIPLQDTQGGYYTKPSLSKRASTYRLLERFSGSLIWVTIDKALDYLPAQ